MQCLENKIYMQQCLQAEEFVEEEGQLNQGFLGLFTQRQLKLSLLYCFWFGIFGGIQDILVYNKKQTNQKIYK